MSVHRWVQSHRWVQNQAFGIQTCTECTAIRARDGSNDGETCREHGERQRRQLEAWEHGEDATP